MKPGKMGLVTEVWLAFHVGLKAGSESCCHRILCVAARAPVCRVPKSRDETKLEFKEQSQVSPAQGRMDKEMKLTYL